MNTTASRVDIDRARQMRQDGSTLQEIGDQYGVTRERIRQLVGSPLRRVNCPTCHQPFETRGGQRRYCSEGCRPVAMPGECDSCGKRLRTGTSIRCYACRLAVERAARELRLGELERLWAEGLSMEEIAAQLGTTVNSLGVTMARARRAGRDLPYRYSRYDEPERAGTKAECRKRFASAVSYGFIRRAARCERCGELAHTDGHHTDYSRPLYVEWVCRTCHAEHHAAERRAA